MADAAAADETFKKLQSHKGVLGVLIVTAEGAAIRSTFDVDATTQYATLVSRFVRKGREVIKHLDTSNDLKFIRIRSKKNELMIAPEFDAKGEYYLVVVQDPTAD